MVLKSRDYKQISECYEKIQGSRDFVTKYFKAHSAEHNNITTEADYVILVIYVFPQRKHCIT